ncbi:MAG: hypothetical protein L0Y72_17030, partial [Gemmataceae bacterium]|nr:hypothetical protein [Gemmataceae bacterium]
MTESEWQTCTSPRRMIRYLRRSAAQGIELYSWFSHPARGTLPRKFRLFLAASCRRVAPFLGSANGRV